MSNVEPLFGDGEGAGEADEPAILTEIGSVAFAVSEMIEAGVSNVSTTVTVEVDGMWYEITVAVTTLSEA